MRIVITNLGKRYNRDWIFRHLHFEFESGKAYAVTGPNGSGKSTLLQIISGASVHNEGTVELQENGESVAQEKFFHKIAFTAPYLEVIEEMTLLEFFSFHEKMKGWISGINATNIISVLSLQNAAHKQIRYFSSGMKQRVKLAQAIFSHVPIVLLDEPLTNLDEEGILLYNRLIHQYCTGRLVIVSSNDPKEYSFCGQKLDMRNYKDFKALTTT